MGNAAETSRDASNDSGGTDELIEFLSLRMFPEKLTASAQSVVVAGARKAELDAYLAGVAEYEGELRALSPEALMQLIQDEQQRDKEAEQEEAERLENERFFNKPTARAYYRSWVERNYWTLDEATALILGKDPKVVNWDSIDPLVHKSPFARRYETLRRQFLRARFDGMLYEPLVPADFLRYAKSVGFALPVELDRLLRSDDEEQARQQRQAMDSMKLAELKEAIERAAEPPAPETESVTEEAPAAEEAPIVEDIEVVEALQSEETAGPDGILGDFDGPVIEDTAEPDLYADENALPAEDRPDGEQDGEQDGERAEEQVSVQAEAMPSDADTDNPADEPSTESDAEAAPEPVTDFDDDCADDVDDTVELDDADDAESAAEPAKTDHEPSDSELIAVDAVHDDLDPDSGSGNEQVMNGALGDAAGFDEAPPEDGPHMNGEGPQGAISQAQDEWYFPDEGRKIDYEGDRQILMNIFVAMAVGRYGHEPGPARDATVADIVRDHRKLELSCNEDVIRELLQEASGYDPSDDG